MARRDKAPIEGSDPLPTTEDSLLIRSAESLGRVIGSLQRELDNATRQLFKSDGDARRNGKGATPRKGKTVRRRAATSEAAAAKPARAAKTARKTAKKPARKATSRKK